MINLEFPYGKGSLATSIPERQLLQLVTPEKYIANEEKEISRALENPIGTEKFGNLIRPDSKIAIIVSDITRPLPLKKMLPEIINTILASGGSPDRVQIIFALGNHRKQSAAEQEYLLGKEIMSLVKCRDFDQDDTVFIGETSYGTPVMVDREVAEADIKICLGNIELHYFAGYTGGYKAILPGVCSKETITRNHSLMKRPGARMGNIEGNPVRMDIEEAGRMVGVDFILNVVLSENKKVLKAFAGHPIEAHRAGAEFAEKIYSVEVSAKADIVLASAGGYPKDMNLYQAQKALENARKVIKPQGAIVLIAQCTDGPGEGIFKQWMTSADNTSEVVSRFKKDFVLGGHKAGMIAEVLEQHQCFLISDLGPEVTTEFFFKYAPTIDFAIEAITEQLGFEPGIIAMPYAHLTMPVIKALEPAL